MKNALAGLHQELPGARALLAACVLAASCSTTTSGAQPVEQTQRTQQKKSAAKPKSDAVYHDLTKSDGKGGSDPERETLRRQLYEQFSIDALLECAKQDAVACPSPVLVRLRVDPSGSVTSVALKPEQPENKVWLACLEATYKQVRFEPQQRPLLLKTKFHVDCPKT